MHVSGGLITACPCMDRFQDDLNLVRSLVADPKLQQVQALLVMVLSRPEAL